MLDWINSLSTLGFVIFVLTVFLALIQLTTLGAHITRGRAASLIPGFLAIVGAVVLFAMTH